jgi:hypothetical protein
MAHPDFEKMKSKSLYVCLGYSNYTYSNNMINRYIILLNYKIESYKMTLGSGRRLQGKAVAES